MIELKQLEHHMHPCRNTALVRKPTVEEPDRISVAVCLCHMQREDWDPRRLAIVFRELIQTSCRLQSPSRTLRSLRIHQTCPESFQSLHLDADHKQIASHRIHLHQHLHYRKHRISPTIRTSSRVAASCPREITSFSLPQTPTTLL